MATVNTMINCDHCHSKIRVRAGIGYSPKQPFSFSCKKCGTHIQGALILKEPHDVEFEFNNATINREIELEDAEFIVECHEDFLLTNEPVVQGEIPKFTPFLIATSLMGDNFLEFSKDMSLFLTNQKELKNKLFRLNNFYIYKKELEFKKEAENIISTDSDIEIFKSLIQLNELYFIPILNKKEIYSNSSLLKNRVHTLLNTNKSELLNYINTLNNLKFFENQLDENLSLIERFDNLFFEIKPIITLNYMDNVKRELLNFSIIDFNKTKQFYVDLFECVGREINVLIGLRNIELNNDFNNLNIAQFNTKIKNFHDCIISSNGNKRQFLENSFYYPLIKDMFDHKLRNGVGHHKCQLNLKTMEVEYYPYTDDIEKLKRESISYIDFIFKLYSLFNLFISLMYLKALLYSIYFASKSKTSLCLKDVSLKFDKKHPLVCLTYYWNGIDYTRPEIIKHDFSYWNFSDIYANFNLCNKDSTHISISLDSDFIFIKIYQTNIYKFKITENRRWLNPFLKKHNLRLIEQMAESIIPLFNVKSIF